MSSKSPDPRHWQQINEYLSQALELDGPELDAWLTQLAVSQPAAANTLRELLTDREALKSSGFMKGSLLAATGVAATPATTLAGQRIGAYTIEHLLGRGGMGEVWLAARNDGRFEGHCAIKFLEGSITQPRLAERFRHEGRLLARLAHEHIARLLDAGVTEDGRQFLVLEFIDGERIDRYCESHQLDIDARVRLFLDVVSAVAHAHTQLVVHRDLKPSNVLVTRQGVVKLLDFGVAKLLSAEPMPDATVTRFEELALTPEYAAPEQLLGEAASTATDVYQLGMLLYVLLAGEHPLRVSGNRAERIKAALNGHVLRPSDFASSSLKKALRGDLDAILMMALDPDSLRRYATAAALREDLVRYLNREPVNARHGTALYRASRFVARHRWSVAASATAVVMLCATLLFALNRAHVAAEERDRALAFAARNSAVTEFVRTLITDAADADEPVTVAQMLARSEELALVDTAGNADNRAAVLSVIASYYGALNDLERTQQLLERALKVSAGSADQSLLSQLRCQHAMVQAKLGKSDVAVRALDQELGHLQADPDNAAYCLLYRTYVANDLDPSSSLQYAQQALERFHAAQNVDAVDEGLFLEAMARSLYLNGSNSEADRYYALALRHYTQLGRENTPNAITIRSNWALMINKSGAPKRALELTDQILASIAQRNPASRPPSFVVANRARALEAIGRYGEARAAYELELRLARQSQDAAGQVHSLSGLASVAERLGDRAAAVRYLEEWDAMVRSTEPANSPRWAGMDVMRGRLDLADGNVEAARAHFDKALAKANASIRVDAQLGRAEAELRTGDATAAASDAQHALDDATSLQGGLPYSNFTGLAWLMLGRAQQQLGNVDRAGQAFESAIVQLSNTVDADHPALVEARRMAEAAR